MCLTDYAPELKEMGVTVPFLEHMLVPPLIKALQKIKPNIIITTNPGDSVAPAPLEVMTRSLLRALEHLAWPYWENRLDLYPSIYYFSLKEFRGNYMVDISEYLENKKKYAVIEYNSEGATTEQARKWAEQISPYEILTRSTKLPTHYEEPGEHEYLE